MVLKPVCEGNLFEYRKRVLRYRADPESFGQRRSRATRVKHVGRNICKRRVLLHTNEEKKKEETEEQKENCIVKVRIRNFVPDRHQRYLRWKKILIKVSGSSELKRYVRDMMVVNDLAFQFRLSAKYRENEEKRKKEISLYNDVRLGRVVNLAGETDTTKKFRSEVREAWRKNIQMIRIRDGNVIGFAHDTEKYYDQVNALKIDELEEHQLGVDKIVSDAIGDDFDPDDFVENLFD